MPFTRKKAFFWKKYEPIERRPPPSPFESATVCFVSVDRSIFMSSLKRLGRRSAYQLRLDFYQKSRSWRYINNLLTCLFTPYMSDEWLPAFQRHQPPTATVFQRPNISACYNTPLHIWEIGLMLLQDSDCGTVSQQNYDDLTSPQKIPSGAKDEFVPLMSAAPCDFLVHCALYKYTFFFPCLLKYVQRGKGHYKRIKWTQIRKSNKGI